MTAEHAIIQSRIDRENAARQALDALECPKLDVSFEGRGGDTAVLSVVRRDGSKVRMFTGSARTAMIGVAWRTRGALSGAIEGASFDLCAEILAIRIETDEAS